MTIFESLRLARLLCALTAVGLGWLALRLCAFSGWLLLPFLLLPSTLFLNASCSQDAVLLAVAGLTVAMLSRPLMAGREFTGVELAVMAGLLALCGTARPPYLAMAGVLFLPGIELRTGALRGSWRRWIRPAIACAGVVAVFGMWRHLVARLGLEHSNEATPEVQAIFLRAHPFAAAWALVRGTAYAAYDFARRGVYVVGWNDLLPHHGLAAAVVVCCVAVVVCAPACPIRTWGGRGVACAERGGPAAWDFAGGVHHLDAAGLAYGVRHSAALLAADDAAGDAAATGCLGATPRWGGADVGAAGRGRRTGDACRYIAVDGSARFLRRERGAGVGVQSAVTAISENPTLSDGFPDPELRRMGYLMNCL